MSTPLKGVRLLVGMLGLPEFPLLLFLVACTWAQDALSQSAPPLADRIQLDPAIWDLGVVFNTSLQTNVIRLRNGTGQALNVTNVIPDCPLCTSVSWQRATLAPGDSMALKVRLDPTDLVGPFSRGITILGTPPTHFPVKLECRGFVRKAFEVSPPSPLLLVRGEHGPVSVNIVPLVPLKSPLTAVNAGTNLSVSIVHSDLTGASVQLTPTRPITNGWDYFSVLVASTNAADPVCRISGAVFTRSQLDWFPDRLHFPARSFPVTRLLHLRLNTGSALSLRDAVTATTNLHCEIERPNAAGLVRIHVTKTPAVSSEPEDSFITVLLNADNGEPYRVTIPVEFEALR